MTSADYEQAEVSNTFEDKVRLSASYCTYDRKELSASEIFDRDGRVLSDFSKLRKTCVINIFKFPEGHVYMIAGYQDCDIKLQKFKVKLATIEACSRSSYRVVYQESGTKAKLDQALLKLSQAFRECDKALLIECTILIRIVKGSDVAVSACLTEESQQNLALLIGKQKSEKASERLRSPAAGLRLPAVEVDDRVEPSFGKPSSLDVEGCLESVELLIEYIKRLCILHPQSADSSALVKISEQLMASTEPIGLKHDLSTFVVDLMNYQSSVLKHKSSNYL